MPPKRPSRGQTLLRELPPSPRLFWKPSIPEQLAQKVIDQNADYKKRALTENEITVLALNEIAATFGAGFFFHLPSRASWTNSADHVRLPRERLPAPPSSEYTTMLFMPWAWGARTHYGWAADSHRARYLRSSAIANPPPRDTPLYSIQYAHQRCPVFPTSTNSLVLFATPDAYYLAPTSTLERILERDRKDEQKFGSANWLWDRASIEKSKDNRAQRDAAMQAFRLDSLESVYHEVIKRSNTLPETFNAGHLRSITPRPPVDGAVVGRSLGARALADCPSRRGEKHVRTSKKRKLEELEEEAAPEIGGGEGDHEPEDGGDEDDGKTDGDEDDGKTDGDEDDGD